MLRRYSASDRFRGQLSHRRTREKFTRSRYYVLNEFVPRNSPDNFACALVQGSSRRWNCRRKRGSASTESWKDGFSRCETDTYFPGDRLVTRATWWMDELRHVNKKKTMVSIIPPANTRRFSCCKFSRTREKCTTCNFFRNVFVYRLNQSFGCLMRS